MNLFLVLLLVLLVLCSGNEVTIKGKIGFPSGLNVAGSLPQVRIIVDNGLKQYLSRADGTVEIHLAPGPYSVDFSHPALTFPTYKLTVLKDNRAKLSFVHPAKGKSEQTLPINKPFTFIPFAQPTYFRPRQQISIASMFMVSFAVIKRLYSHFDRTLWC